MYSSEEQEVEAVFDKEKRYIMQTYRRPRMVISEGKGARLKDLLGNEYIDCVGGMR